MSAKHDYDKYFPYNVVRDEQRSAVEFALNAFLDEGKQFVVLEMGTGCGKSATGVTIARYLAANMPSTSIEDVKSGAYVLTTQKVLQKQYVDDFGPATKGLLRSIKSSKNYTCQFYPEQDCGSSKRVLAGMRRQLAGTDFQKCCSSSCPYTADKQAFVDSPISVTNFSYFLAETMYARKLEPREVLIIDECHNVESELGKFIEVTFSEKFATEVLKCKVPKFKGHGDELAAEVFKWVSKKYKQTLEKHVASVEKNMHAKLESDMEGMSEISKRYEMLDMHLCKVNRFINTFTPDNWVMNVIKPQGPRQQPKYEFKPIDVSSYGYDMLYRFGVKVLMMSATIVDKDVFCRSIGLPTEQVAFMRIPSPFPIENRQIHVMPVGSMSMSKINETLPMMVEAIKFILEEHKNDKGIIHCVSFKIAQHLYENLGRPSRLLIHGSDNRDQVLDHHVTSTEPTVLLSPSMMEGVNLADNASRFQILCKIPFPYLGDLVVKKRKDKDPMWYGFQTAKSIIQAMGRSVRNENDHATSYVLDADWVNFMSRSRSMFPTDFLQSIIVH